MVRDWHPGLTGYANKESEQKEMTTLINREPEAIDFEALPEYSRENQLPSREASVFMSSKLFSERPSFEHEAIEDSPKSDELEALWPGVHHDFPQPTTKRSPSFYLTVGFMAGALLSLILIGGFLAISHFAMASKNDSPDKKVLFADGANTKSGSSAPASVTGTDVLSPSSPSYEVQPGDTLLSIALHNYKRVSPRLLDEICRVNNMRNANVLNLGQKLALPVYHPNQIQQSGTSQLAATSGSQIH
jgi:LysM repeat protein